MFKFKIGDCVEVSEQVGDAIHQPVVIPKGAVGVIESVNLNDDDSITYDIMFSDLMPSNFCVLAKFVSEESLEFFAR